RLQFAQTVGEGDGALGTGLHLHRRPEQDDARIGPLTRLAGALDVDVRRIPRRLGRDPATDDQLLGFVHAVDAGNRGVTQSHADDRARTLGRLRLLDDLDVVGDLLLKEGGLVADKPRTSRHREGNAVVGADVRVDHDAQPDLARQAALVLDAIPDQAGI